MSARKTRSRNKPADKHSTSAASAATAAPDDDDASDDAHQPHDKIFKSIFGNTENAAAFLQHHLPQSVS
ncbi:MAG: Rpn family recombination-promoting nuclease/putative transposase, partial [Puniceicoccales bacterium]|nr:Rpn family recombination-promoting nuclease/putative transposase [Puniceicoccales bacterium]